MVDSSTDCRESWHHPGHKDKSVPGSSAHLSPIWLRNMDTLQALYQIVRLNFHCLHSICNLKWQDRYPNSEVLVRYDILSTKSFLRNCKRGELAMWYAQKTFAYVKLPFMVSLALVPGISNSLLCYKDMQRICFKICDIYQ